MERQAKAAEEARIDDELASLFPAKLSDDEFDRLYLEPAPMTPGKPADRPKPVDLSALRGRSTSQSRSAGVAETV